MTKSEAAPATTYVDRMFSTYDKLARFEDQANRDSLIKPRAPFRTSDLIDTTGSTEKIIGAKILEQVTAHNAAELTEGQGRSTRLSQQGKDLAGELFVKALQATGSIEETGAILQYMHDAKAVVIKEGGQAHAAALDKIINSLKMKLAHFDVGHNLNNQEDLVTKLIEPEYIEDLDVGVYERARRIQLVNSSEQVQEVTNPAVELRHKFIAAVQEIKLPLIDNQETALAWQYIDTEIKRFGTTVLTDMDINTHANNLKIAVQSSKKAFKMRNAQLSGITGWITRKYYDGITKDFQVRLAEVIAGDENLPQNKKFVAEKARQIVAVYGSEVTRKSGGELHGYITAIQLTDRTPQYERQIGYGLKRAGSALLNTTLAMATTFGGVYTVVESGVTYFGRSAKVQQVNLDNVFKKGPKVVHAAEASTVVPTKKPVETKTATLPIVTNTATEAAPTEAPTSTIEPTDPPTAVPTVAPTELPTSTPELPTATPDIAMEIGNRNMGEYLFGGAIGIVKENRAVRGEINKAFVERVNPAFLNPEHPASNFINILLLGVDGTRKRDFNGGDGLADIMMYLSFNPYTLEVRVTSLPRDAFMPETDLLRHANGKPKYVAKMNSILYQDRDRVIDGKPVDKLPPERYALVKSLAETASGIPVDGVIQSNIDFFEGYSAEEIPSIFGVVFNEKYPLQVTIPYNYRDVEYPEGLGKKTVEFHKGEVISDPIRIVEWIRTRKGVIYDENWKAIGNGSDAERQKKEQALFKVVIQNLMTMTMDDLQSGHTDTLERIVEGLRYQNEKQNFFTDENFNIIELLQSLKNAMDALPLSAKVALALNSADEAVNLVANDGLKQFKVNVYQYPRKMVRHEGNVYESFVLPGKIQPNKYGDCIEYYKVIRDGVAQMFGL
ncbi:MAG: hypothetical protein M3Q44_00720 [bacterium]|nr:hypothetical protein [bacterium]